jgi:serine/threonine protein kinase
MIQTQEVDSALMFIELQKYSKKRAGESLWIFGRVGVLLFAMLSGELPFGNSPTKKVAEDIVMARYDGCEGGNWDYVTDEAKDLIRRILVVKPEDRPTVDQLLQDPWFNVSDKNLSSHDLSKCQITLQRTHTITLMKKVLRTAQIIARFKRLLKEKSTVPKNPYEEHFHVDENDMIETTPMPKVETSNQINMGTVIFVLFICVLLAAAKRLGEWYF